MQKKSSASILGLIHTHYFCTQYWDKFKDKKLCNWKDIFLSKYCGYISKFIQINRNKYFQFAQEKSIGWKIIAISFHRNIVRQNVSCEQGLRDIYWCSRKSPIPRDYRNPRRTLEGVASVWSKTDDVIKKKNNFICSIKRCLL